MPRVREMVEPLHHPAADYSSVGVEIETAGFRSMDLLKSSPPSLKKNTGVYSVYKPKVTFVHGIIGG